MERRTPKPLMDLRVILHQDVIVSILSVFFALLIMGGGMFLSVLYAQLLADALHHAPSWPSLSQLWGTAR